MQHLKVGRETQAGRRTAVEGIQSVNASKPQGKNRFVEFAGQIDDVLRLELLPSRRGFFQLAESPLHPAQAQ